MDILTESLEYRCHRVSISEVNKVSSGFKISGTIKPLGPQREEAKFVGVFKMEVHGLEDISEYKVFLCSKLSVFREE